jgi:hypothetical protein
VNKNISVDIQFKASLAEISADELALLKHMLPELLQLMQAENDRQESTTKSVE